MSIKKWVVVQTAITLAGVSAIGLTGAFLGGAAAYTACILATLISAASNMSTLLLVAAELCDDDEDGSDSDGESDEGS